MATIAEMTREGVLKGEVAKTAHFRLKINWCAAPKSVPTLWQPPLGNSVKEKLEEKHVQGGTTICCNQFGVREESRPKTTKKQKTHCGRARQSLVINSIQQWCMNTWKWREVGEEIMLITSWEEPRNLSLKVQLKTFLWLQWFTE